MSKDENRYQRQLIRIQKVWGNVLLTSLPMFSVGFMMAITLIFLDDSSMILGFLISLAFVPFVLSIYQTMIQSSFFTSLGVFDFIKTLPTDLGGHYFSMVIALDLAQPLALIAPSVLIMIIRWPATGIIAGIWMVTGIFAGHLIGLGLYYAVGTRVNNFVGRYTTLKNIVKIFFLVLLMAVFFLFINFQEQVMVHAQILTDLQIQIYPFSLNTVFQPLTSSLLLLLHLLVLIPSYLFTVRAIWRRVQEPKVVSTDTKTGLFTLSIKGELLSFIQKDYKMILRKTPLIIGFIFPILIILPNLFMMMEDGYISRYQISFVVFMISLMSVISMESILKVDAENMDFLRTLPITKKMFVKSKALGMSLISTVIGIVLVSVGVYFEPTAVLAYPFALMLPMITSFVSMGFLFRYDYEDIGVPDTGFLRMILIFIILIIPYVVIGVPIFFNRSITGFSVSYLAAGVFLYLSYRYLSKV